MKLLVPAMSFLPSLFLFIYRVCHDTPPPPNKQKPNPLRTSNAKLCTGVPLREPPPAHVELICAFGSPVKGAIQTWTCVGCQAGLRWVVRPSHNFSGLRYWNGSASEKVPCLV